MKRYQTIIWATDGSEVSDRALAEVKALGYGPGQRVVVAHWDQRLAARFGELPLLADEPDLEDKIRHQATVLSAEGYDVDVVIRHGHESAADMLAALAEEVEADLIVLATPGHSLLGELFLGSTTQRLLRHSPCPVLVVPVRPADVVQEDRVAHPDAAAV